MIIFDWDDTIQKNLNPKGSLDMFLKTIFYPCNRKWVKRIFHKEDQRIITTRSKLYTFAIRLKCFLITFNFKAFSDTKITTINPFFFFNEKCINKFSNDQKEHMQIVEKLKIDLAVMHDYYFNGKPSINYSYIDLDKYESKKETR